MLLKFSILANVRAKEYNREPFRAYSKFNKIISPGLATICKPGCFGRVAY